MHLALPEKPWSVLPAPTSRVGWAGVLQWDWGSWTCFFSGWEHLKKKKKKFSDKLQKEIRFSELSHRFFVWICLKLMTFKKKKKQRKVRLFPRLLWSWFLVDLWLWRGKFSLAKGRALKLVWNQFCPILCPHPRFMSFVKIALEENSWKQKNSD